MKMLILSGVLGEAAYYLCGLAYYFIMFNYVLTGGQTIGIIELMSVWFLSTVVPDLILCVLASAVAGRLWNGLRDLIS